MGLPRSTFYDVRRLHPVGDGTAKIVVICDEFETSGYRRVRAELRHQWALASTARRSAGSCENGLQPKRAADGTVITTNSDYESDFRSRSRIRSIDGPNQLGSRT